MRNTVSRNLVMLSGMCILFSVHVAAQLEVAAEEAHLTVPPNREDVKAVGMGRTQIANGHTFNAMAYNPALLARKRTTVDILGVGLGVSRDTPGAISFLMDNKSQFSTGQFINELQDGAKIIQQYINNGTGDQVEGLRLLNHALAFTRDFQDKVLGSAEDPRIQAVTALPVIQVQAGNWGVSLGATLHGGFTSMMTDALARIYALRLPNDLNTLTLQEILDLLAVVDPLIDPITGKLSYKGAIPNTYAVAILDITGTVGYGMQVTKALSVGAAIKVINRRFSNKVISAENYDGILSEVRNDFNSSRTGVTLDVGALYRIPKTNLDVAMSLQNIIPTPALDSDARVNTVVYDDAGGVFPVTVKIPFRLTMPFLMNCGANYSLTDGWDASFDWVDIAAQDERFEHYVDRFRLGTEYRLTAGNRALVVAFRGGLATSRPTAGIGFNVYDVFHLDGAYAYDPFFGDYAWYGQVRFGW